PAVGARLNADGVLEPAARTRFSYDASERASDEAETNGGPASAEEEPDSSAPTVASNSARAAMMFEALQAQPDEDAAEQAPPPRASGRRAMFEGGLEPGPAPAAAGATPSAEDAPPSGGAGRTLLTLALVGAVAAGAWVYFGPE